MSSAGKPTHPNSQPADATPCDGTTVPCPDMVRRENLMFVGSEMSYDSFWLKMMFIASAYVGTRGGQIMRPAHKTTIAYVDAGYTKYEKLTLDQLRAKSKINIVKLATSSDIVKLINTRTDTDESGEQVKCLLQDVAFFSHGVPGSIKLNYEGDYDVNFSAAQVTSCQKDAFVPDGRIYSYACRTGVSSYMPSFKSDQEAGMESSLAQLMANYFKVQVHAFLRRSFYGDILREKSASLAISTTLKEARETQEGQLIQIPPEHEALPHPGLSDGFFLSGPVREGTNEYALWRKAGGIRLPSSGDTPKGLSIGMHVFSPAQ